MNKIELWYIYGLFAFFSTFSVYNGQRLIKSNQPTETPWLLWVQRNERSLYLATFASGLATFSALLMIGKITMESMILLGVSGVISFFYVVPIKGVVMREIPYIKIYLIAITWAVVLILFPNLNENDNYQLAIFQGAAHTLYIIAVAIPFDIRDVKFDQKSQRTIPQVLGVLQAKIVASILLLLFWFVMVYFTPVLWKEPVFHLAVAAQIGLVFWINERRGDLYCAGAIDASIGLLGISYFLV